MKKAAFLIKMFQNFSFHGGGEKLFSHLIKTLANSGYAVDIYCSFADTLDVEGINKVVVINKKYDYKRSEKLEDFYAEAKKLISYENYDFVISENITPPVDITFLQGHSLVHRQKKLKNVFESLLYFFRPVKRNRIKFQDKWMKQGYRKIFVPSNTLKSDIVENFKVSEDKISVIYPGVDVSNLVKSVDFSGKEEIVFGLSAVGFNIKGGYVFIKALQYLKARNAKFKAKIIYPKHSKNKALKTLLKIYGLENSVEFLDFQKNMDSFFESVDCVVMPSFEDTFGLIALEAMAKGKPVIVSSYAGASEIVNDGKNGFVFNMDKNRAANLADKMLYVINNKEKISSVSAEGIETAKVYSWQRMSESFIQELEKLSALSGS